VRGRLAGYFEKQGAWCAGGMFAHSPQLRSPCTLCMCLRYEPCMTTRFLLQGGMSPA
jgi:hypothetical protein